MTTLRKTLFKILCNKTVSQLISINHRQLSKKTTPIIKQGSLVLMTYI